jgi:cytochrome P450
LVTDALNQFSAGDEIDVIEQLAYPVPFTIICDLLGVPDGDRTSVREWSRWMARVIDPPTLISEETWSRAQVAQTQFATFVRELICHRQSFPGDDLLSDLVAAHGVGSQLTQSELIGLAVLILVAGHETTVNLIGNGTLALLGHREQAAFVATGKCDPKIMIDELLRFDSPVQMTTRTMLEPLELSTMTVPAGQKIITLLGAANHDRAVFDNADQLDVMTPRSAVHLSLGTGIHHCLGAALARVEGEIVVSALLRRFPNSELIDEGDIAPSFVLRGRQHLRVRLA